MDKTVMKCKKENENRKKLENNVMLHTKSDTKRGSWKENEIKKR
jgi:hypothetical protein